MIYFYPIDVTPQNGGYHVTSDLWPDSQIAGDHYRSLLLKLLKYTVIIEKEWAIKRKRVVRRDVVNIKRWAKEVNSLHR